MDLDFLVNICIADVYCDRPSAECALLVLRPPTNEWRYREYNPWSHPWHGRRQVSHPASIVRSLRSMTCASPSSHAPLPVTSRGVSRTRT